MKFGVSFIFLALCCFILIVHNIIPVKITTNEEFTSDAENQFPKLKNLNSFHPVSSSHNDMVIVYTETDDFDCFVSSFYGSQTKAKLIFLTFNEQVKENKDLYSVFVINNTNLKGVPAKFLPIIALREYFHKVQIENRRIIFIASPNAIINSDPFYQTITADSLNVVKLDWKIKNSSTEYDRIKNCYQEEIADYIVEKGFVYDDQVIFGNSDDLKNFADLYKLRVPNKPMCIEMRSNSYFTIIASEFHNKGNIVYSKSCDGIRSIRECDSEFNEEYLHLSDFANDSILYEYIQNVAFTSALMKLC